MPAVARREEPAVTRNVSPEGAATAVVDPFNNTTAARASESERAATTRSGPAGRRSSRWPPGAGTRRHGDEHGRDACPASTSRALRQRAEGAEAVGVDDHRYLSRLYDLADGRRDPRGRTEPGADDERLASGKLV